MIILIYYICVKVVSGRGTWMLVLIVHEIGKKAAYDIYIYIIIININIL